MRLFKQLCRDQKRHSSCNRKKTELTKHQSHIAVGCSRSDFIVFKSHLVSHLRQFISNKHNLTLLVSSSKVLHPIAPIIDQDKALCPPYIHMHLYNMHLDEAGASRGNTEITDSFYYKTNVQINRACASNYIIYVHDFIIHVHLSSLVPIQPLGLKIRIWTRETCQRMHIINI